MSRRLTPQSSLETLKREAKRCAALLHDRQESKAVELDA